MQLKVSLRIAISQDSFLQESQTQVHNFVWLGQCKDLYYLYTCCSQWLLINPGQKGRNFEHQQSCTESSFFFKLKTFHLTFKTSSKHTTIRRDIKNAMSTYLVSLKARIKWSYSAKSGKSVMSGEKNTWRQDVTNAHKRLLGSYF